MKQDPEFFGDTEMHLLYIAKRLSQALKLEEEFTAAGIDYIVEPDRYRGGFLFASERIGAFFYVTEPNLEQCRSIVRSHGWRPHDPEDM